MTTAQAGPVVTFDNGVSMPALGLGVLHTPGQQAVDAVRAAIGAGYRLIDTAEAYGNEAEVGAGITASGVTREELFVTTKLMPQEHGYDSTLRRFDESMTALGLGYLDLFLVHWPLPQQFDGTIRAWKAMERLVDEGRVRAIGVSNFTSEHLDRLAAATDVEPALNQIELHPYFNQAAMRAADTERGIVTQSWSPMGGIYVYQPSDPDDISTPLQDGAIAAIAEAHGVSPAQVVLRWHLQHGLSAIPKSVKPERIVRNADLFGFELTDADMAAIDALDADRRGGPHPDVMTGV